MRTCSTNTTSPTSTTSTTTSRSTATTTGTSRKSSSNTNHDDEKEYSISIVGMVHQDPCKGNGNTTDATCDLSEASSSQQDMEDDSSSLSSQPHVKREPKSQSQPSSYEHLVQQALKNYTALSWKTKGNPAHSTCLTTPSCDAVSSSNARATTTKTSSSSIENKSPSGNDVVLPEVPHEYKNPQYFRQAILDYLPLYAGASECKKIRIIQQILSEVTKRGGKLMIPPTWNDEDLLHYCQRSLGQLLRQILSSPLLKEDKNEGNYDSEGEEESTEIFLPESRRNPNPAFFKGLLSGCIYEYAEASSTVGQTAVVTTILTTLRRRKYTFRVPQGWTDIQILQSLHKSMQARLRARGLSWVVTKKQEKKISNARPVSPFESPKPVLDAFGTATKTTATTSTPARAQDTKEKVVGISRESRVPDVNTSLGKTNIRAPFPPCFRPYSVATSTSPWCPPPPPVAAPHKEAYKKNLPVVGAYTELLRAAGDKNKSRRKRRRTEPDAVAVDEKKTIGSSPQVPNLAHPFAPYYHHSHHHYHYLPHPPPAPWLYHHPSSYGTWAPQPVPSSCVSSRPHEEEEERSHKKCKSNDESVSPSSCPSATDTQNAGMLQTLLKAAATVDVPESAFKTKRV